MAERLTYTALVCLLLAACSGNFLGKSREDTDVVSSTPAPVENALAEETPVATMGMQDTTVSLDDLLPSAPKHTAATSLTSAVGAHHYTLQGSNWKARVVGGMLHLDELPGSEAQVRPIEATPEGKGGYKFIGMEENGHPFTLHILPLTCKDGKGGKHSYTAKLVRTRTTHTGCGDGK